MAAKYLAEAGIYGASVHSLQHTFGTHTVKRGPQLRMVQEVLSHAVRPASPGGHGPATARARL